MSGIFDRFREKVIHSVWKESVPPEKSAVEVDDKIALGVLLWVVAEADSKFLSEEKDAIKDVLKKYSHVSEEDLPVVLESIAIAAQERIDLYTFTQEVLQDLPLSVKKDIVETLFRVACVDQDLSHEEEEMIRKISGLFRLDHKDFIDAKLKVKKEFGINVI